MEFRELYSRVRPSMEGETRRGKSSHIYDLSGLRNEVSPPRGALRRGSVYHCSSTVRKMKALGAFDAGRFLDSLCEIEEENDTILKGKSLHPRFKSSEASVNFTSELQSVNGTGRCDASILPAGYFEFVPCKESELNAEPLISDFADTSRFECDQVSGPLNNGNELEEIDTVPFKQNKSSILPASPLYAEGAQPRNQSETQFQTDVSKHGAKIQSHPSTKMRLPHVKAKHQQHWKEYPSKYNLNRPTKVLNKTGEAAFQKSLLHDYSYASKNVEAVSAAVLHAHLKSKCVEGVPLFEFSTKCLEEVLISRTWKTPNSSNFVYTFHSGRKSKRNNLGLKHIEAVSSIMGQMQSSCYLHSEIKEGGVLENSVTSEFVLYDIAHAINQEKSCAHDTRNTNFSSSHPWESSELQPGFEIAAIVMRTRLENVEQVEHKHGDKLGDLMGPNFSYRDDKTTVQVLSPVGSHGLPNDDSLGPSSLLDRWKLGGGCDCGGWDMACPLIVFGNGLNDGSPFPKSQRDIELFIQGIKGKTPALTLKVVEEGCYEVNFDARLSTLQAFSICVAILHGAETSAAVGKKMAVHLPMNNYLKTLIQEAVEFFIRSLTEEKPKEQRTWPNTFPSLTANPPCSPIARV